MRERIEPLGGKISASFVKDGFLLQAIIPEEVLDD